MKKTYQYFIIFLSILLFSSCRNEKPAPNILFIMSDDHTSQAWGIYGGILQDYVINTNIKRLADEGAMLTNAYCTNSICTPSRGSILTGKYSHHNGIYTLSEDLSPDSSNIAKELQKAGYQTAIIGKWHLKEEPAGFDHYMVLPGQGRYHNPILKTKENWDYHYKGGKEYPGFSTDVITDFSLVWLQKRDPKKPFFLMTQFKATHEPFDYPDRYKDLLEDVEIPEPETLLDFGAKETGRTFVGQKLETLNSRWEAFQENPDKWWTDYPGMPFSVNGLDSVAARKKIYQKFVKDFIRCGAAIDDNIGRLLDYLEESGIAENTVVIYTADQGYFLGEHGFFDKRLIYEESLRMPFIIRYPKEIKAGEKIADIVLNVDFASLFADYAGIEAPDDYDGKTFRENLRGKTSENWRKSMYYRYWLHQTQRPAHFGIKNNRYKLAFFYGQPLDMPGTHQEATTPAWEFYDLQEDPLEEHNAYHDSDYQDIIKEMKNELLLLKNQVGDNDKAFPIMNDIITQYWEN